VGATTLEQRGLMFTGTDDATFKSWVELPVARYMPEPLKS
jgi:hypothetical protein